MSNILLIITIPLLSFFSVLLDTAFFSFYEVWGSTIISSFAILLVLSVLGHRRVSLLFATFAVLFLSAFSSISIYILLAIYLGIPLLIFYIRTKFYFESSLGPAVVTFLACNLIFRITLLPLNQQLDQNVLLSMILFPAINTLVGIIIFVLAKRIFKVNKFMG